MLKSEDEDMMERRRLTAHFFRCFHLLGIFLTEFIENGSIFKNPQSKKALTSPEKVAQSLSQEKKELLGKKVQTQSSTITEENQNHHASHNVYFSFSRLSNILLKIGIDIERFN